MTNKAPWHSIVAKLAKVQAGTNDLEHENNKLAYENINLKIELAKMKADRMMIRSKLLETLDRADKAEADLARLQERYNMAVLDWDVTIGKYHSANREAERLERQVALEIKIRDSILDDLNAEIVRADMLDHALNVANQALYSIDKG